MNQNQKGFVNIVLVVLVVVLAGVAGYFALVKTAPVAQQITPSVTTLPSSNTVPQNPPTTISQLTKEQVLNGFDQCDQQFKNGTFEFPGGYEAWSKWELQRYNEGKPTCAVYESFIADIVFADLDGDGINEAIVPGRAVTGASGGLLYIFKNVNGVARVIDSVIIGVENINIVSVNNNIIVGKTTGGPTPTTQTYKFVNGKLIKQ